MAEERATSLGLKLKIGKCQIVFPTETAAVDLFLFFPKDLLTDRTTGTTIVLRNPFWIDLAMLQATANFRKHRKTSTRNISCISEFT